VPAALELAVAGVVAWGVVREWGEERRGGLGIDGGWDGLDQSWGDIRSCGTRTEMHCVDGGDVATKRLHDEGRHRVSNISENLLSGLEWHVFLLAWLSYPYTTFSYESATVR
jgi:hypothetical protein